MNKFFVCSAVLILSIMTLLFFIHEPDSYNVIEALDGSHRRARRARTSRPRHHHGRRWYGGNIGYGYRRPPFRRNYPRYVPWWTSSYWFVDDCKDGCTNIGNNVWGCQYPGNGPNDCVFANDCYGCMM